MSWAAKNGWRLTAPRSISAAEQHIVRESSLLLGTNVLLRGFGVLRGIVVARLLAPGDYGLLTAMLVAAFYLQALELGVGWGTNREIPLLRGRHRIAEVELLEREVFWWEVTVGLIVTVGVAAYASSVFERWGQGYVWLALPLYVLSELVRNTLQCFLQAREAFPRLRRSMLLQAVVDLILAVTFTRLWGFPGAIAGLLFTSFGLAVYLVWDMRHSRLWVPARIRWPTFRLLMAAGLPLMVQNLMWANMTNVDKLVILATQTRESLAFYAMAQTIAASMFLVSSAVSRVNSPMMVRRFGETADPLALHGMFYRTALILAYGLPLMAALMWLAGPWFFSVVLPDYKASVALLDVTSLTFYAMSITLGVSSVYIALGLQVLNGLLLLTAMIATAIISVAFISAGWGVLGVAIASALSACAYLITFLAIGLRSVGRRGRDLMSDLARVLAPLGVCILSVILLGIASKAELDRTWISLVIAVGTAGLALLGASFSRTPSS